MKEAIVALEVRKEILDRAVSEHREEIEEARKRIQRAEKLLGEILPTIAELQFAIEQLTALNSREPTDASTTGSKPLPTGRGR